MRNHIPYVVGLLLLMLPAATRSDVRLPKIFTHKMVLQQQLPIAVWGWADPDGSVTVTFNGKTETTTADKDGEWRAKLPAMNAKGKSHQFVVQGKNTIRLQNAQLGEVWI